MTVRTVWSNASRSYALLTTQGPQSEFGRGFLNRQKPSRDVGRGPAGRSVGAAGRPRASADQATRLVRLLRPAPVRLDWRVALRRAAVFDERRRDPDGK